MSASFLSASRVWRAGASGDERGHAAFLPVRRLSNGKAQHMPLAGERGILSRGPRRQLLGPRIWSRRSSKPGRKEIQSQGKENPSPREGKANKVEGKSKLVPSANWAFSKSCADSWPESFYSLSKVQTGREIKRRRRTNARAVCPAAFADLLARGLSIGVVMAKDTVAPVSIFRKRLFRKNRHPAFRFSRDCRPLRSPGSPRRFSSR